MNHASLIGSLRMPAAQAVLVAALLAFAPAVRGQGAVPDRAQVERRLDSVATLIERSSAARQVESSGDPGATERRARARELHRQASSAFGSGDVAAAARLLDQASREMFDAVRQAAPEQVVAAKRRDDYQARLESVRALREAINRIAPEKSATADAREISGRIDALVAEAGGLAGAGRHDEARLRLDQAYLVARSAVGSLRGGDTLVRSLTFASKEEEYRYEIDRNDTHRMLIKVLVEGRGAGVQGGNAIGAFVARAEQLRGDAEKQAGGADFEGAIRLLEDSTRELVRAIRSAGIYIPG